MTEPKPLQGVIFDHSTLLVNPRNSALLDELRNLVERLRDFGLTVGIFSTHPQDIDRQLRMRGLPPVDLFLTRADLEARWPGTMKLDRPSPKWMQLAAESLGIETYQLMYVGDERKEWLTATNAAVFYLHAGWRGHPPVKTTSYVATTPGDITGWLTHFLLLPPRWQFALDDPDRGFYVRSLLYALVELPGSREGRTFSLQQVFGHQAKDVRIGDNSARDILMLHALAGLYLEGFISPNSLFAVYPSSTPGRINDRLGGFLDPVSKLFGGYFREDLLIRAVPGKDTSLERVRARRENRLPGVSYADQTNTVHLNPRREKTIRSKNRTVLVFDDFTTSGRSLDWARNLLLAGGAARVVLMTVGKYPGPYFERRWPLQEGLVVPYEHTIYAEPGSFTSTSVRMREDPNVREIIATSFEHLRNDRDYPLDP